MSALNSRMKMSGWPRPHRSKCSFILPDSIQDIAIRDSPAISWGTGEICRASTIVVDEPEQERRCRFRRDRSSTHADDGGACRSISMFHCADIGSATGSLTTLDHPGSKTTHHWSGAAAAGPPSTETELCERLGQQAASHGFRDAVSNGGCTKFAARILKMKHHRARRNLD